MPHTPLKTALAASWLLLAGWTGTAAAETGLASYYGPTGHRTASGRHYTGNEAWCAHRHLRFGTHVRVTRLDNGRSVRCEIQDRGPFVRGRIIDVSPRLARGLGLIERGIVRVMIEVLD